MHDTWEIDTTRKKKKHGPIHPKKVPVDVMVGCPDINPIVLSKCLYLFRCAIGGFIDVFMPIFWSQIGLTSVQIGTGKTVTTREGRLENGG